MEKPQRNYLNMAQAVCDVFATDSNWQGSDLVTKSLQKVKDLCSDINQLAMHQQQNKSNGHTATTDVARTNLEDHLYTVSLRLMAWARDNNDMVVQNQVKNSRSVLSKMPLQTLFAHARSITEVCKKNVTTTANYLVSTADIVGLEAGIDNVAQLNGHRDAVIDTHMEQTARLKKKFASLRKELKVMDTLVEAYVTNGIFPSVYFNARRIHDVRRGSASTAKDLKQAA